MPALSSIRSRIRLALLALAAVAAPAHADEPTAPPGPPAASPSPSPNATAATDDAAEPGSHAQFGARVRGARLQGERAVSDLQLTVGELRSVPRRYAAELALLPPGVPGLAAIHALIDTLEQGGRALPAALRVARQLVIERLAVLDVEAGASLADVTGTMTALAEATLERALQRALSDADARHVRVCDEAVVASNRATAFTSSGVATAVPIDAKQYETIADLGRYHALLGYLAREPADFLVRCEDRPLLRQVDGRPQTLAGRDSVEALFLAVEQARAWLSALRAEGFALCRDRAGAEPFSVP